eukprot:TRINITY_DN3870_c0_g1_i1.p1 TRINITY_DN3870_c0_g1~~TRINITY_DN3870_c0_g1_i1.p1  ORF type:complete len:212 (+),score=44.52 TRINITY_DN3870_c0_g1_i1:191-826(+)
MTMAYGLYIEHCVEYPDLEMISSQVFVPLPDLVPGATSFKLKGAQGSETTIVASVSTPVVDKYLPCPSVLPWSQLDEEILTTYRRVLQDSLMKYYPSRDVAIRSENLQGFASIVSCPDTWEAFKEQWAESPSTDPISKLQDALQTASLLLKYLPPYASIPCDPQAYMAGSRYNTVAARAAILKDAKGLKCSRDTAIRHMLGVSDIEIEFAA